MALFDRINADVNSISYRIDVRRRLFEGGYETNWQPLSYMPRHDLPRQQLSSDWLTTDLQRKTYFSNIITYNSVVFHANQNPSTIYDFDIGEWSFTLSNRGGYYNNVDDIDSIFFGAAAIPLTQIRIVSFYVGTNDQGKFDYANNDSEITLFEGYVREVFYDTKETVNFQCFSYLQLLDRYIKEDLDIETYIVAPDTISADGRTLPVQVSVSEIVAAINRLPLLQQFGVTCSFNQSLRRSMEASERERVFDGDGITGNEVVLFERLPARVGELLRDISFYYDRVPLVEYSDFKTIRVKPRKSYNAPGSDTVNNIIRLLSPDNDAFIIPLDWILDITEYNPDGGDRVRTSVSDGNVTYRTSDKLITDKYTDSSTTVNLDFWGDPQIKAIILRRLVGYWSVERPRATVVLKNMTASYFNILDRVEFDYYTITPRDSSLWEDDNNPATNLLWDNFNWSRSLLSLRVLRGRYMITRITHDLDRCTTTLVLEADL